MCVVVVTVVAIVYKYVRSRRLHNFCKMHFITFQMLHILQTTETRVSQYILGMCGQLLRVLNHIIINNFFFVFAAFCLLMINYMQIMSFQVWFEWARLCHVFLGCFDVLCTPISKLISDLFSSLLFTSTYFTNKSSNDT